VSAWTIEAKQRLLVGEEAEALSLYRKAADLVPGAPWLQQRAATLARKLGQTEAALGYCRRAATAFSLAGLRRRALTPLRTAWQLALEVLPQHTERFVELTMELSELQGQLGLPADALSTFERGNRALRNIGHAELSPVTLSLRVAAPQAELLKA
jgi:tetratricopeptide (TPR) repeat protein